MHRWDNILDDHCVNPPTPPPPIAVQLSVCASLKMIVSVRMINTETLQIYGVWDFWSFAGVAVLVAPHILLHVGVESRQQFCLRTTPSLAQLPLQYTVCVGDNIKSVYQASILQLSMPHRELPSMNVLRYGLIVKSYV